MGEILSSSCEELRDFLLQPYRGMTRELCWTLLLTDYVVMLPGVAHRIELLVEVFVDPLLLYVTDPAQHIITADIGYIHIT